MGKEAFTGDGAFCRQKKGAIIFGACLLLPLNSQKQKTERSNKAFLSIYYASIVLTSTLPVIALRTLWIS